MCGVRKRDKWGGYRRPVKGEQFRPSLPSILLANVRALWKQMTNWSSSACALYLKHHLTLCHESDLERSPFLGMNDHNDFWICLHRQNKICESIAGLTTFFDKSLFFSQTSFSRQHIFSEIVKGVARLVLLYNTISHMQSYDVKIWLLFNFHINAFIEIHQLFASSVQTNNLISPHWKYYAIVFLQNTSQIRLLPFDHCLIVMLLNNRLLAI